MCYKLLNLLLSLFGDTIESNFCLKLYTNIKLRSYIFIKKHKKEQRCWCSVLVIVKQSYK